MSDIPNPIVTTQRPAQPELPRRFYKTAAAGPHAAGFAVLLDGKVALTPARKPLAVADRCMAEALAAEWEAQGERLDPAEMPLTRIVNAAIDRVAGETKGVRAEIVKYAGTDLICYRAEGPQSLISAQAAAWDPLVDWVRQTLGARLVVAEGIVHVAQDDVALAAIESAFQPLDALSLAAVSTVTALTGSAVIALAVLKRRLTVAEAWAAAHVDEDWQMSHWGSDEAALARRASRRREIEAAGVVLSCSTDTAATSPQPGHV